MAAVRMGKETTMPAGLICASVRVRVAKEEESKEQLVKPKQLPIYTAPPLQSLLKNSPVTYKWALHPSALQLVIILAGARVFMSL